MGLEDTSLEAEASTSPSDAPPAEVDAAATKENARREKEAQRARVRRLTDKLKATKSEGELKALMRKMALGEEEAETVAKLEGGAQVLEPGQKPGWPPPSEILQWEATLGETLATAGELVGPLVAAAVSHGYLEPSAQRVSDAVCAVMGQVQGDGQDKRAVPGPAGERLAKAWAPIAAKYAPAILVSPWWGAAFGTLGAGVIIGAAVSEALAADKAQEGAPA